jgi:hypothetical protein
LPVLAALEVLVVPPLAVVLAAPLLAVPTRSRLP